ncbi:MAG: hypothetical protein ACLRPX_00590 [Ruthenibacterium sp.]
MEFSKFVTKAGLYDKRNTFAKFDGCLKGLPDVLQDFYRENNPIDVEINNVRFSPVEELGDLQAEYSYLNAQLVFATCNGDPIFLQDGHVYTAPHGVKNPKRELLSENIEAYFLSLVSY